MKIQHPISPPVRPQLYLTSVRHYSVKDDVHVQSALSDIVADLYESRLTCDPHGVVIALQDLGVLLQSIQKPFPELMDDHGLETWGVVVREGGIVDPMVAGQMDAEELFHEVDLKVDPIMWRIMSGGRSASVLLPEPNTGAELYDEGPILGANSKFAHLLAQHQSFDITDSVTQWVRGKGRDTQIAFVVARRSDFAASDADWKSINKNPSQRTYFEHGLDFRRELGVLNPT